MPNLKDIKNRIASVKKTRQITSAMKLVAGAKLKRATERAVQARPYQRKLTDVLSRIAAEGGEQLSDPLLQQRDEVKGVYLAVLTADRGLCGPFNGNLLRKSLDWIQARKEEGLIVHVRVYGRKGDDFLRSRKVEHDAVLHWDKQEKMDLARDLSDDMRHHFDDGRADEVWLAYNHFVNTMTQRPTLTRVVPLTVPEGGAEAASGEHRWEPSADELMARLLPLYLRTVLLQAFLETEAGFYAAQMTAMDNATRNASDLIDNLTLDYNRARQAAITKEIIEIVSGAEAL